MWILFQVPCPTPDGRNAQDLYEKRATSITDAMRESARSHGCRFHRAWYSQDGSAFYALAEWETAEGANAFFTEWKIDDEPGEVAIRLEGDVGLVALPQAPASELCSWVDSYWEKLSAVPESEACGWLKDRFGVSWQIVPTALSGLLADPDRKKADQVMEALRMKKLDIAKLKAAAG